jgi:hypothetical protein
MKSCHVGKDNTGHRKYEEEMIFPTLSFPSDHAVVSATLISQVPYANHSVSSVSVLP